MVLALRALQVAPNFSPGEIVNTQSKKRGPVYKGALLHSSIT